MGVHPEALRGIVRFRGPSLQTMLRSRVGYSGAAAKFAVVGGYGALFCISVLSGRSVILGSFLPFALAVFVCSRVYGRVTAGIAGTGAVLGVGSAIGWFAAVQTAACMTIVELCTHLPLTRRSASHDGPSGWILSLPFAVISVRLPVLAVAEGFGLFSTIVLLFELTLAIVLSQLLRLALGELAYAAVSQCRAIQPTWRIFSRAQPAGDVMAKGLIVIVVFIGLQGVSWGGFHVQGLLSDSIVLVNSIAFGPSLGAVGGLGIGLLRGLTDARFVEMAGLYGVLGLITGMIPTGHRRWVSPVLFLVAKGFFMILLGRADLVGPSLLEGVVACAIQAILPTTFVMKWRRIWTDRDQNIAESSGERELSELRRKVACVTGAFSQVARYIEESCASATWLLSDDEIAQKSVRKCLRLICDQCLKARDCRLSGDDGFLRSVSRGIRARGSEGTMSTALRSQCHKAVELDIVIRLAREIYLIEEGYLKKVAQSRRVLAHQMSDILAQAASVSASVRTEGSGLSRATSSKKGARDVLFSFKVGVAGQPSGRGSVSGDTYLVREIDGKLLLMLSDGMGTGARALRESRSAAQLVEKLVEAGLSQTFAVKTLNSLLFACSVDGTFTTIDFVLADLRAGEASCVKVGAPPSFLIRGNDVKAIRSPSPPAGVLTEIELRASRFILRPQDTLVMMTDGLVGPLEESDSGEDWIRGVLLDEATSWIEDRRPGSARAQKLAAKLIDCAVQRRGNVYCDDMTVLVVQFCK